ncbi:hypothetical protein JOD54_005150 [Actinokineospora baliensis]|uniref:hypothetical protein n=1 Tax=Actinokineospora baliensis TaxID=547056 RepID=UPI00195CF49E|nr:hypothetical protein [Actinokineospora baliensis]MBM7774946.1 hypothetical protein [Actinokineospora baliensis]
MSIKKVDLSGLLDYWAEQRERYKPGAYVLVLCGNATELDRATAAFVRDNPAMLDDMSGPYTSVTLVAWRADDPAAPDTHDGLSYLHTPHAERLGAANAYSLANSLQLPLDRFPLVLVSADPWEKDRTAVFSLRDLPDGDDSERLAKFFAALLTACTAATPHQADKRLRQIRKHVESHLKDGKGALNAISESGILAQVIEGLLKGLGGG